MFLTIYTFNKVEDGLWASPAMTDPFYLSILITRSITPFISAEIFDL